MITLQKLYQRDKGICHICTLRVNRLEDASREHKVPKYLGGTAGHRSNNIFLAHKWCNEAKGKKLFRAEQHKTGWVVVDPNDKIISQVYPRQIDALVIATEFNEDKMYLDKYYD